MERSMKVIIIEDNIELLKSIQDTLSDARELIVCGVAKNGYEGIELINTYHPDIILLDIIMPKVDGFGVLEYLLDKEDYKPYTIMISALNHEEFVQKAMELGAQYYIAKPFDLQALKNRVISVANLLNGKVNENKNISSKNNMFNPMVLSQQTKSVNEKISSMFITIGIPAHIKGYHFLREAIKMVIDNPDVINRITKELYPGIAKKYNTSASKVERAIRHAIEVAWTRGKIENLNQIFGYNVYGRNDKPTNGEFIALIADKLMLERSA